MSPSSVLFRLPRAHKNTHARTSSESASSSRSLPPPLYLFALLSPSLSPDSSHVCSTGARARGTAGAAFAPSDVCVRLCRSLINTGTGTAKLTSPTSLLTLSQGFQALKNKKKAQTLLHPSVWWQNDYSFERGSPSHSLLFSLSAHLLLTADTVGVAEEIVSREYLRHWKKRQLHCGWQEILTPIHEDFCTIQDRHFEQSLYLDRWNS